MAAIRVMIGDMPPLLRSLVEGMLNEDTDLQIVTADTRWPRSIQAPKGVDVLVVSEDAMKQIVPLPTASHGRSALGVVAIAANGLDAAVVRLSAHRRPLDDERRHALSVAIRDAAGILREAN